VVPAEPSASPSRRRTVLTTFGSLGDLHPYIAVALGLKARGQEAVIASSDHYRQKIEALGIGFRAVRPRTSRTQHSYGLRRPCSAEQSGCAREPRPGQSR